jgi:hypothetical protein
MAQRMQQGNIVGYVLVGALLLGLIVGGIFVVKNYTTKDTVKSDSTAEVASSRTPSTDDDLQRALEEQAATQKKQDESAGATQQVAVTQVPSTSALPTTGPEELVMPLLGVALLTSTSVAYIRSRLLI